MKQNNSFTADQSLTDITILENNLAIGTNSFINTQAIGTIILKLSCTKEANSSEPLVPSLFRQFMGSDEHVGKFLWSWSESSVPSPPTTLHGPEIRNVATTNYKGGWGI